MTSRKRPWPVLFACCVLGFNALGMVYGLGAIFTDLMDTFGVSRATASLVQSVCTGVVDGCGIFSGHLLRSWGPRKVVIVGSVLATIGFVIAFLGNHIAQVIVGIGVIAGCGASFTYLTSLTLPGIMFNDIRSLAMGITTACSGAGSAVFPLLLRHVTNEYSVRGTFLIMAAMNCQMIVCGALIGLYTPWDMSIFDGKTVEHGNVAEVDVEDGDSKAVENGDERKYLMPDGKPEGYEQNRSEAIVVDAGDDIIMERGNIPTVSAPLLGRSYAHTRQDVVHLDGADLQIKAKGQEPIESDAIVVNARDKIIMEHIPRVSAPCALDGVHHVETDCQTEAKSQENESNPDDTHFLDKNGDGNTKLRPLLKSEGRDIESVSLKSDNEADKTTPGSCCSLHAVRKALFMPIDIFRDVRFFMMSVVGGSSFLFFTLPLMFMTDIVRSNNISVEDGTIFITIISVGNLIGRTSSGFLYKLLKSRIQIIPSVAIVTGGITCLLLVFCKDYVHFVLVSLLHGLGFGLCGSTFIMSVLEIVGPARFPVGTGYLIFCDGVFALLAGPYGGLIRDLTNSYEPLYYIAVVHGLIVGASLLFTTLRYQQRP